MCGCICSCCVHKQQQWVTGAVTALWFHLCGFQKWHWEERQKRFVTRCNKRLAPSAAINMLITFHHTVLHLLRNDFLPSVMSVCFCIVYYYFILFFWIDWIFLTICLCTGVGLFDPCSLQTDTAWAHSGKWVTRVSFVERSLCFMEWKMAACWTFIHNRWCTSDLYRRRSTEQKTYIPASDF